jgi:hypothetical protein
MVLSNEEKFITGSISSSFFFGESCVEIGNRIEQFAFINERQQNHTLPSVTLAVEINHKVTRIEFSEWGVGVLHQSTKGGR